MNNESYNIDSDKQDEQWLHQKIPSKKESDKINNAKRVLGIK